MHRCSRQTLAQVDAQISQEQIAQLPITSSQGRNFQTLYTLLPGAAAVQEQNSVGGNPARALSVNLNGVSYNTNTTRIDGAVNDYGWLPYLLAYLPPADSIQSVNVVTNSFQCRPGRSRRRLSIAITMKGGTSQYHGSGCVLPGRGHQRPGLHGNPGISDLRHKSYRVCSQECL